MPRPVDLPPPTYPPATRGRVVLWGMLAAFPFGGMTWQALHHLAGLRRIGFDVWYVEDTDSELIHPETFAWGMDDWRPNADFLARHMDALGLSDRWVFRLPGTQTTLGACNQVGLQALYRQADAVINLCGYHRLLATHDSIRRLIYLQTDPVADQIKVAQGDSGKIAELSRYHLLATYAEHLGAADCAVPVARFAWVPTRPPICLDWWDTATPPSAAGAWTTVSNWQHRDNGIEWQGQAYPWRKDLEFRRFIDLPGMAPQALELALEGMAEDEKAEWRARGWRIVPASGLRDPMAYRRYIQDSLGEFTVAKAQFVRPRSGWFSDRSASYLAAGRPVITPETGFSAHVPSGRGLFSFEAAEDILEAMDAVLRDPVGQGRAAREIAQEFFGAEKLLDKLMSAAGL